MEKQTGPIGVFDSGYGGLTILKSLVKELPDHDFLYLGDNARTPYGTRSFESVYAFTLQGVKYLFGQGCSLVVLACNTASAKALRSIQQRDLPTLAPDKRVLGVIRPTTEVIGKYTKSGHIGILGTTGTVKSESYSIEIDHFFPEVKVFQQACPMWVPLVENSELSGAGVEYFVKKHVDELMSQSPEIDTVLMGCTHYPLLSDLIRVCLPEGVQLVAQGEIVAKSLVDYLKRHSELDAKCTKNGELAFRRTDGNTDFDVMGSIFFRPTDCV